MNRLHCVVALAIVLAGGWLLSGCNGPQSELVVGETTGVGGRPLDIAFTDASGVQRTLSDLRADAFIVAFVDQSCQPEARTGLVDVANDLPRDVQVVEVSISPSDCEKFGQCVQMRGPERLKNMTVLCDGRAMVRETYGVKQAGPVFVLNHNLALEEVGTLDELDVLQLRAERAAEAAEEERRALHSN
jgi:hypothetical protein